MKKVFTTIIFSFIFFLGLVIPGTLMAMEKPSEQEIIQYKQDGTFQQRVNNAKTIGNYETDPYLVWRAERTVKSLVLKEQGKSETEIEKDLANNTPPSGWIGLPTTGTPKVLTLLVDFPDYPHTKIQTKADFSSKFFGNGDSTQYPYDSLRNYYQRSSYNQLTITGDTLGWYRAAHNRDYYGTGGIGNGSGQDTLIKEVLNYYNAQGYDFSQYDNNNDGKIESIYIKWTGPDNGWSNFWWGYQWAFHDSNYTIDGKHLGKYVWSWYSRANGVYTGTYSPQVDIHETGHALGLPDYYDYDGNVGPDGGLGGLDMMDANWGDHNSFSKFLLNWITPTIIPSGTQLKTFNPSGTSKDAAIIMPSATSTPFKEYFITQYRKRSSGNDPSNYPTDGMLIWHVDANLNSNGSDYLYNNSNTAHKLLTLEQADGLGEIENGDGVADAGDYYISPKTFGSATNPNSKSYSGATTNVIVDSLTPAGATMSARVGISSTTSSGVLQFSSATYSVSEAGPTAIVTVSRVNGSDGPVGVTYATSNGTATAGSDYTTKTGTLSFASGEVTKTFTIPITNDTSVESNETVILKLSNPTGGATLGTPIQSTLTIVENDIPASPTGLTATVPSSTSILLKWNPVNGATSYNVYRLSTGSLGIYIKIATVTSTNYTNTGLTLGTTYSYKVSATNGAGTSALSSAVSAKIAAPDTPTGLTATVPSSTSILLKWNPVSGATSYDVYRLSTGSLGIYIKIATVTGTNYTNTGLTLGTTYSYKVSATNGAGTSALSSAVSAKIAAPDTPTGLTATVPSSTSILLKWNPVSGATSYNVYRLSMGSLGIYIKIATVTSTNYTNTGLTLGTTYSYKVSATNGAGTSALSSAVSAKIAVPDTPTNLSATVVPRSTSILLKWNPVSGATSYDVYRLTGSLIVRYTKIATVTSTNYTNTGLTLGTTYSYKVSATNRVGTSALSSAVSARP